MSNYLENEMAVVAKSVSEIINEGMKSFFDETKKIYTHHKPYRPLVNLGDHILEQCGKKWRVKKVAYPSDEIKTGWLKYKEADALLKIFKAGEENGTS